MKSLRSLFAASALLLNPTMLGSAPAPQAAAAVCDENDAGIWVPDGFCASLFAVVAPHTRQLAVAPNGDVYVAVRNRGEDTGRMVALRDADGDGRAERQETVFANGGTEAEIYDGYLYFAPDDAVLRWALPTDGSLVPPGTPDTIVYGLPSDRSHAAKTIAFDGRGGMFVNIGAPSNVCQPPGGASVETPGMDPCPELEHRSGVWRFDADRLRQSAADGERWATGIRNAVALGVNPNDGVLYGISHGRDRIDVNWPHLYTARDNAEKTAEELFRLDRGTDGGWPYCFYDRELDRKVLAPEYGGDTWIQGRCARKAMPLVAFPAHWAPNDVLFYTGDQFPEHYGNGMFVAFHGSWNRAPLPQAGFNVAFAPMDNGQFTGGFTVFADDFADDLTPEERDDAAHRPMGLAQMPDGSMLITDSQKGHIWRVYYTGERDSPGVTQAVQTEERSVHAGARPVTATRVAAAPMQAAPPRAPRAPPAAPAPASGRRVTAAPAAVTPAAIERGEALYATICVACHGPAGAGSGAGPSLRDDEWLHVDGDDLGEIARIIREGVMQPLDSPTVMPPRGGGNFSDADIDAIAAYVYSLTH